MIADLKPYSEYKDSGLPWLGRVPGHWDVRKLKQVSRKFWSGGTPQSGNDKYYCDAPHGYPWLMISDLTHQRRVRRTRKHITEAGLASRNLEMLPTGTVLFSMYASLGTAAVLEIDAAVNQAIIGISPRHTVISSDFALYSLEQLKTSLPSLASSSTQANLNAEKVRSLQISLPPPAEQAAIVRFLDWANGRLERAIRAKRKVIALLNEQKQAIIHRAVTRGLDPSVPLKPSGIPWLGDIPQHWETPLNQRIFKEEIRPHNGVQETQLSLSQRDGLIATSDMKERSLQTASYDNWKVTLPGDLVLNRFKAHLGVFFGATLRGIVSFHYGVFAPQRRLYTKYFELLFHTYPYRTIYAGRSNGMTVGLQNLSNQNFYGVRAAVPPHDEQVAIVDYAERETQTIRTAISRLEREIELLREYRTRLVADVVTGKLDVRDAAARLPDEAPPDTVEDGTDLSDEIETADEEVAV